MSLLSSTYMDKNAWKQYKAQCVHKVEQYAVILGSKYFYDILLDHLYLNFLIVTNMLYLLSAQFMLLKLNYSFNFILS